MKIQFGKQFKLWAPIAALTLSGNLLLGQATAASPDEGVTELDPFTVTATKTKGWGATASMGGTRINLPINDVPITIVVINREFMDDVGASTGLEALNWVGGMHSAANINSGAYSLRGQLPRGSSTDFMDGLPSGVGGLLNESEFLDRWEVIKGAAGSLYGDHSLGGLVNRVMKQPLRTRQTVIKSFFDSLGSTSQFSIDSTGPIDQAGELTYRAIGVMRKGEIYNGGANDRTSFYATVNYAPKGSRAKFWLRWSHFDALEGFENPGAIVDGLGKPSLGVSRIPNNGTLQTTPITNNGHLNATDWEFGASNGTSGALGDWDFRAIVRYTKNILDSKVPEIIPLGFTFLRNDGTVLGTIGTAVSATQPKFSDTSWTDIVLSNHISRLSGPNRAEYTGIFLDLTGKFNTGPLEHRLLIYGQQTGSRSRSDFTNYILKPQYGGSTNTNNLDLTKAFSIIRRQFSLPRDTSSMESTLNGGIGVGYTSNVSSGTRYNMGVQDNIYLWDKKLLLVAGMRYDYIKNEGSFNRVTRVAGATANTTSTIYKVAAVVKPFENKGVSLFANYAETFQPLFGEMIVGSGKLLQNIGGISKEAGVKLELYDAKLILTAAYFKAEVTNLTIFEINPRTGFNETTQGGVSPSHGWDLDMTYTMNDNWTILVGLANVYSRDFRGLRLRANPDGFLYKTLVRYTFSPGPFDGLSAGIGVDHHGRRPGDTSNTYFVDGFNNYDGFVSYSTGNWRFNVNAFNLTDERSIIGIIFQSTLFANDPRHVRFSAQYRF